MDDFNSLAEVIVKRRKFLGLTQTELAERAGVALRSLKSIELAEGNPTFQQLSKILYILGMKLTIVTR
jgi:transcriptional regulator with XRE-family HTH domain